MRPDRTWLDAVTVEAEREARRLRDEARADHPPAPVVPGVVGERAVTVEVSCPRCGSPWQRVNDRNRRYPVQRELRAVLRCVRPGCGWEGYLLLALEDMDMPRDLKARVG